jgi:hypothetical protein
MKRISDSPARPRVEARELWSEALWGVALIGSVLIVVAILGWFFRP